MVTKKFALIFLFLILISGVSAIVINEVEMNPPEGSEGIEWVELYNDKNTEVNISGWEVWEGIYGQQGPKLILSIPEGITIQTGSFYIIEWSSSKLNNAGDFVILYDSSGNEIDRTETLEDKKKDDQTHQLCNGTWKFVASTKEEENNCPKEETNQSTDTQTTPDEETKSETSSSDEQSSSEKEVTYEPLAEENPSSIKLETINLNPKVIKTENNNEEIIKSYAFYGFVAFSVFLGVLFIIRKNRYKNEFR